MAITRAVTFENASLTGAGVAADSVSSGGMTLDSASTLKGKYCAVSDASTAAFGEIDITGQTTIYVSMYVMLPSLPSTVRVLQLLNAGTTLGNIQVTATGAIRLRLGGTQQGSDSSITVSANQPFRIGIKQFNNASTGTLDAYVALGDADFDTAFASATGLATSGTTDAIRFGGTSAIVQGYWDDIRIDDAQLPSPSIEWLHALPPFRPLLTM